MNKHNDKYHAVAKDYSSLASAITSQVLRLTIQTPSSLERAQNEREKVLRMPIKDVGMDESFLGHAWNTLPPPAPVISYGWNEGPGYLQQPQPENLNQPYPFFHPSKHTPTISQRSNQLQHSLPKHWAFEKQALSNFSPEEVAVRNQVQSLFYARESRFGRINWAAWHWQAGFSEFTRIKTITDM